MTRAHVLYFAIHADAEAAEQVAGVMAAYRRRDAPTGRIVGPEGLQIALNRIGDYDAVPDAAIRLASDAADRVIMPVFRLSLDRLGSWQGPPGERPLVLYGEKGVVGVDILYDAIGKALQDVGAGSEAARPDVLAHMTLSRGVAEQPPEVIRPPVSWQVREFALVHTPPGDLRRVVARFPLRD